MINFIFSTVLFSIMIVTITRKKKGDFFPFKIGKYFCRKIVLLNKDIASFFKKNKLVITSLCSLKANLKENIKDFEKFLCINFRENGKKTQFPRRLKVIPPRLAFSGFFEAVSRFNTSLMWKLVWMFLCGFNILIVKHPLTTLQNIQHSLIFQMPNLWKRER